MRGSRLPPVAALLAAACALNPISRQPELVLVSEQEERAAGEEAAAQVEAEMGLVKDRQVTSLVAVVGARVAAQVPAREGTAWRFAVVDLDEPNAFALPGGFVYVSRGTLALANSEDELANVIAHEIVHVAARHHAQRQARAAGVGLLALPGLLAGAILPGLVGDLVSAPFEVAGAGLVASYGRDQEREADELGQQLAARAGYDPAALASFLASLEKDAALREEEPRVPSWFDTHPSTSGRGAAAAERASGLAFTTQPGVADGRAGFLRRVDGLLLGENPAEGVFEGQRFLHPDLGFTLVFPEGWRTLNTRHAVGAVAPGRDAQLALSLSGPGDDPREAASAFFQQAAQQMRIEVARLDALEVNGLAAVRGQAVASARGKTLNLDLAWIALRGSIYQLTGAVEQGYTDAQRATFGAVIESFRALSSGERERVRELRLRVFEARAGETLASAARRAGDAWSPEQSAAANALAPDAPLAEGQLLKVARREPYRGAQ
jgi:predicted Zn-dependent protease